MTKRDYYEILGIERGADKSSIKKAYRKMAMKYHPDQNQDDKTAEELFKEAAEAYDVLSDDKKRQTYDQYGHEGLRGSGFSGGGGMEDIFSNFGDIFGDLFGGGRSRKPKGQGADLQYPLTIELEGAATGLNEEIEVRKHVRCSTCNGSGAEPGTHAETCGTCRGHGQVTQRQGFFAINTPCPECHGSGQTIKHPCVACHGDGKQVETKRLTVKVPAGIEAGQSLRLIGEGEPGMFGAPDGNLYVVVDIAPHKVFERHGADLVCSLPVSFVQATLGAEINVPTLLGEVTLTIPRGTQTHTMFKVRGEGMPRVSSKTVGDLHVQVVLRTPEKLTDEQQEHLRKFAASYGEDVQKTSKGFFEKLFS